VIFDVLFLGAAGVLALLAGGLILFLSPGRYPSLLAAVALGSLGVLQFGWARAMFEVSSEGASIWFHLSLAFALPVALSWVLLSRTIGLGARPLQGLEGWRFYIFGQALICLGALVWVAVGPAPAPAIETGERAVFPLSVIDRVMLATLALNGIVAAAGFEATYFAYSRTQRRRFRPGLVGTILCGGQFVYLGILGAATGRLEAEDMGFGAYAVVPLALLLPLSMIRGRIAEEHVRRGKRSVARTTSLALFALVLVALGAVVWLSRVTGMSVVRGLWLLFAIAAAVGMAALAISNRVRRRVARIVDPYWLGGARDHRALASRFVEAASEARTFEDLCERIPSQVREMIGADPVTIFVASDPGHEFVARASTIDPIPRVAVRGGDPLVVALYRAHRAIRLRGRSDDLEYIPIYVENGTQILACAAACAAPITFEDQIVAFLLCGERAGNGRPHRGLLRLLDVACHGYSHRIDTLLQGARR
jgi:hypothetical protein